MGVFVCTCMEGEGLQRLIMDSDSDAPWSNRNESETALPIWQYA